MNSTIDRYDCSHKHRGYALIFVNEDVKPKRTGALEDGMNMEKLFSHLKFNVSCRSDVLAEEIVQTLKDVLSHTEYLKNSDCFVFVISTHGTEILLSDGKTYQQQLSCSYNTFITTQEIVSMVSNCKSLEGKPKLFFIQACRIRGKIDRNTQEGRDSGHTVLVRKEDSHDETTEDPKHSPLQFSLGHTEDASSEEETRQKLANLDVTHINKDGDLGDTTVSQNSVSATTDENSELSAAVKVGTGHSIPESSLLKNTADASQNSASATTDEDSELSEAVKVEIGHSIPESSLLKNTADASQNSASAQSDESSELSATMKVEIGHSIPNSSLPVDAGQNSASAQSDESSELSAAMKVGIGHSIPNSSLPVDAGQNSASTTTDQASKDPAAKKMEIRPFITHFSCPKDTLIMYAVPPGYIARRQSDGVVWDCSVMLETLKNVLINIPEDKSLLAALTEVVGRVARDYEYSPDYVDYEVKNLTEEERRKITLYKIVPVINHTLQYDFYFTKKDD